MQITVHEGDKEKHFRELKNIRILALGKVWEYSGHTGKEIRFKVESLDGQKNLGNYVRGWRLNKKFTQADVAARFNITQPMVAKIESGKRHPPEEMFKTIWKERVKDDKRRSD